MRCRNCGAHQPIGLSYVCPACFGPLEVAYDYAVVGATLTREAIAARAPGIWRYAELLPVDAAAGTRPAGRLDAAHRRRAAGAGPRARPAVDQGRHAEPVAVLQGPGGGGRRGARASSSASRRLPAPRPATWPARRPRRPRRLGLPAYVFIPADLEPAKVDHALAYGATVVPIEGTYDDVNRLCLEVADETGWGFVNINLRPFYAEGSKTLAYEIAESLGWRSPDVVVAPVASGAMFTRVARGFEELAELGLIERRPIRFVGGQAAGCAPVATALGGRHRGHRARSGRRTRSSARWPSAIRPTVGYAVELADGIRRLRSRRSRTR